MSTDALDHITVKGFKSIASIEHLELRRINILIGANGSGKSNFIGVFSFLHAIREGRLGQFVTAAGGAEKLLHFGSKTTPEMSFHLSFADKINQYRVTLAPTENDGLFPAKEISSFWDPTYQTQMTADLSLRQRQPEAGISDPSPHRFGKLVRDRLGGWRVYHIHDTSSSSPMRKTARLHDNGYLRPDGSNLAPFLYLLREQHTESYKLIREAIAQVAPFFDDFLLKPLNLKPDDIKLEWRHKRSDQYFDPSSLSDGTLRFIVLATLFLQPESLRPSMILVDEPELGLHPYAIEMLAGLIRQAAVTTQVLISTQSSLLLDHFGPEDVLIAERDGDSTRLSRPDPDRLAAWLEDYSLGQLWEKNQIGGRPVSR